MSFARSDRKPCTYSGCDGTMRFIKSSRGDGLEVCAVGDPRSGVPQAGEIRVWVCDTDSRHFEETSVEFAWRV
jgi:hypothetical protein